MEKDLVSIVVPVYNAEPFLEDTINTVLKQTYTNWELLLINDCSTDNSKNIAKKYLTNKKIKWIDLIKNGGPALARNKGVDLSTGNFLCFLDADDLWDNNKLEVQVEFMKKNNYAFSYTSYEFADEYGKSNGKKVCASKKLTYKMALANNNISTITVMFDLSKIEKPLIYMPNLKYVEDTATWWKILRNGYNAYGIKEVYSYYRRTEKSLSSNKFRTLKRLWKLYRSEEKLNLIKTIYYFSLKNINAILRRI